MLQGFCHYFTKNQIYVAYIIVVYTFYLVLWQLAFISWTCIDRTNRMTIQLKSVVTGICQQCTVWSTFTIFHWNCWLIELWPRVVILWSWADEWRWSFHPHSFWQILPLKRYSPPAWLALKRICRTLFWCTLWSQSSLGRLCIGHVIWRELVIITPVILLFI